MKCSFQIPRCRELALFRCVTPSSYWRGRVYCARHRDELVRLSKAIEIKPPLFELLDGVPAQLELAL